MKFWDKTYGIQSKYLQNILIGKYQENWKDPYDNIPLVKVFETL